MHESRTGSLGWHACPVREGAGRGGVRSQTHYQGPTQWQYNDWVAQQAGPDVPPLPAWREAMYNSVGVWKQAHPEDYRDTWRDPPSEAAAEAEVAHYHNLRNKGLTSGDVAVTHLS